MNWKLMQESFIFALRSLILNRLRTFLSLLGITIGIFAMITVFTVIDSLENSVRSSIAKLGDNVVYVQKWPWSFEGDYPWWKYINRPLPSIRDFNDLLKRSQKTDAIAFLSTTTKNVQYEKNSGKNIEIWAVSQEFINVRTIELQSGRYFSSFESTSGKAIAILGGELAEQLFENQNPIDKEIKIGNYRVKVIGVLKREGEDMFGMSMDKQVIIPLNFGRNFINLRSEMAGSFIMAKAKPKVSNEELMDELRNIMRSIHRLKPTQEDDFALNLPSVISQGISNIFVIIDFAGLIIGGFAILVGGFGIANIMFVSVKEQTRIIGIQKALGAKRMFILLEFLYEAVMLSLIGGIFGLFAIFLLLTFAAAVSGMEFNLGLNNILLGIIISVSVGLISGFIPAYSASKLDPVNAINSN